MAFFKNCLEKIRIMNSKPIENERTNGEETVQPPHRSRYNSMELDHVYSQLSGFGYVYIPGVLRVLSWFILIVHFAFAGWVACYYGNLDRYPVQNLNPTAIVTGIALLVQGVLIFVFLHIISLIIEKSIFNIRDISGSLLESISETLHAPPREMALAAPRDQITQNTT